MIRGTIRAALALCSLFLWRCGPSGIDEHFEYRVLASVTSFSVPDSGRADDIRVSIAGVLGPTTAFSLMQILADRQDTLWNFWVYARQVDDTGVQYEEKEIRYDTTLVVSVPQPQSPKLYFFIATGSNGTVRDSSYIY